MTTIAYRNGVMAADTGGWFETHCHPWAQKIARSADGSLWGVAGNAAGAEGFLDWVRSGCRGEHPRPHAASDERSSFVVLRVTPDGSLSLITAHGVERYPAANYFAIGGGAPVAMGAMFAGASANLAIEAAMAHSSSAIGRVATIKHEGD